MINKIMPQKILSALILIICLLVSSGCWGRREITELNLELGSGIDYWPEEEQIVYTALVARPELLAGAEATAGSFVAGPIWVAQASGETLFEAFRNLASRSPRRTFASQTLVVIIGEELAREGIAEVVDFYLRQREQRLVHSILIARGKAADILKSEPEIEDTIPQEIANILETLRETSNAPIIDIKDFVTPLLEPGIDALAPVIEVRERVATTEEEFPLSEEGRKVNYINIEGSAAFSGEKLSGFLTVPETKGALWVRNEIINTIYSSRTPEGEQFTVSIRTGRAELTPDMTGDNLKIDIKIFTKTDLHTYTRQEDIHKPETIELLEEILANLIKQEILLAISRSQELKSDFLGFGAAFRRKDHNKWNQLKGDWRKKLAEVEVNVIVNAVIRRPGLINRPVVLDQD